VATVLTRSEPRASYLRRLAVVFADELRLRIVTELYMQEMSPTSFFREFGGGSVSRVDRHFKRLASNGWLKLVKTETGGARKGGKEHFYRATELAVFDSETWSHVPYSIRVSFSWRTFRQLAERVREALLGGTFRARADSHLSWTPMLLDQLGWDRVIAEVDAFFESLFEEQDEAKVRVFESGERPMLATVALSVFESPTDSPGEGDERAGSGLVEGGDSLIPFPLRVSKVFADDLCMEIVAEANRREISPTQFHREVGGAPVSGVRRRFKMLAEIGWLREVAAKTGGRRRGAIEHFYRATGPATFDRETEADVPDSIRSTDGWRTFDQLSQRVREAIEAGTFEARTDNHLSWLLLRLDRQGWERVTAAIDALIASIAEERKSAALRLADSGERPITTTAAFAAFESPWEPKAH
jgi:hypothetical protein